MKNSEGNPERLHNIQDTLANKAYELHEAVQGPLRNLEQQVIDEKARAVRAAKARLRTLWETINQEIERGEVITEAFR